MCCFRVIDVYVRRVCEEECVRMNGESECVRRVCEEECVRKSGEKGCVGRECENEWWK